MATDGGSLFHELPTELLVHILSEPEVQLDIELYYLSKASRRLNHICLPILFALYDMPDPTEIVRLTIPCHVRPHHQSGVIFSAMGVFFQLTHIKELHVEFDTQCDLKPYVRDIKRLNRIISRLQGLERLYIQFEEGNHFLTIGGVANQSLHIPEWAEHMQALFDTIAMKQPTILSIVHGSNPPTAYYPSGPFIVVPPREDTSRRPSPIIPMAQLKDKFLNSLSMTSKRQELTFPLIKFNPPRPYRGVAELYLGTMSLRPPCSSWVLSLLWHSTKTLTSINLAEIKTLDSASWKRVFSELAGPMAATKTLESVSIVDCHALSMRLVCRFLHGITSIRRLSLVGSVSPRSPPPKAIPNFQHLAYLRAPHDIFVPLVGSQPLPALASARVDLRSTFMEQSEAYSIHAVVPALGVLKLCAEVEVHLPFKRYTPRALRWDLGRVDGASRERLGVITALVLDGFDERMARGIVRDFFVEWLGMFSGLKRIGIWSANENESVEDDMNALCLAIDQDVRCRSVEKVTYNRTEYEIKKVVRRVRLRPSAD